MRIRFASAGMTVAAMGAVIVIGSLKLPPVSAQPATADWEKAAGAKMSFDVASVKPDPPGTMINLANPNMPLDSGDAYPGNTTLFSANMPTVIYIAFAYKLSRYQLNSLMSQLPKWGKWIGQGFNIQARAANPATKDQMRLMMQSLLADRFKLAVHWEKRQVPSYDLVAIKPGKTGPQMQPHDDKTPCQPYAPPSGYASIPGQLPNYCGGLVGGGDPGGIDMSGRNVTTTQLADWISGTVQCPVLDKRPQRRL